MPGEQHILIVFANCHKDNGIFAKRLLVSHGPLTAKIRSTDMAIEAEQRIKLESMQIKGIRWMIWQSIDREDIESRLLSIKGQGSISDLTKFINSQSRATLIKLIEASPEIVSKTIDAAYEKYRYGLKPGFTLFWAKRNDKVSISKIVLENELKAYISTLSFDEDEKYKGLEFISIVQFGDTFEISLSYLQRFNYINSDGEFTYIYMMKECFVWVGIDRKFIAINNMPEVLMTSLKRFFSKLYQADITNIKITNSLLKKVFSSDNTKRITRHNPNPPENQLEKITIADPKLSEKMACIPSGYEEYDVTNTQYIEEIDSSTSGTLGVNCDKGKLYLSKSLTSSQFRAWSMRRIDQIIGFYENSTDVSLETISGLNMFSSENWDGVKQQAIPILNEIAFALVSCKLTKAGSYPLTKSPYEVNLALSNYFYERVSFVCDACEERVIPACDKCGSSTFNVLKKEPARISCMDCGQIQTGRFSFSCESGHTSYFESIDEVLELISRDSFTNKLFCTISKYFPNVIFDSKEFFTITMSGVTILRSPSYEKLKPSDIEEFSEITKRTLVNDIAKLETALNCLKEKCSNSTNEKCLRCQYDVLSKASEIKCILRLFEDFEGFTAQPHQGHEFGDVSMLVSLNGNNLTFLGVAKAGSTKVTKASKLGREIIQQVIDSFIDERAEITGVIYPGIIDDQLKQLLYHEAKVHNKRLTVMDHEFMINLIDYYICKHGLVL